MPRSENKKPDPEAERALLARFLDPATSHQAAPALLDALRPRLWDHLSDHWRAGRREFDDLFQDVVEDLLERRLAGTLEAQPFAELFTRLLERRRKQVQRRPRYLRRYEEERDTFAAQERDLPAEAALHRRRMLAALSNLAVTLPGDAAAVLRAMLAEERGEGPPLAEALAVNAATARSKRARLRAALLQGAQESGLLNGASGTPLNQSLQEFLNDL